MRAIPLRDDQNSRLVRQAVDRDQPQAGCDRHVVLSLVVFRHNAPITGNVAEHDADDGHAISTQCGECCVRDEQLARMEQGFKAGRLDHRLLLKMDEHAPPVDPDACRK